MSVVCTDVHTIVTDYGVLSMGNPSKTVKIAKTIYGQYSEFDRKIIEYLSNNADKKFSYDELAKVLEIDKNTITRRISKLQDEGLLLKLREGRKSVVKWIGGVLSIEAEIEISTQKQIKASLLAENFDIMILDPFSPFSLLFEDHCWEVMMNFKEGVTDQELSQSIGSSVSLDTIRRVMVICNSHNIISIKTIRSPASGDVIRLFEPLYRIEFIHQKNIDYLRIIRGLASAMSLRMENKQVSEASHIFDQYIDDILQKYYTLENKVKSTQNVNDRELLGNMMNNYDFASDFDRLYRQKNWRKMLKDSNFVFLNSNTESVLVKKTYFENKMNKSIGDE